MSPADHHSQRAFWIRPLVGLSVLVLLPACQSAGPAPIDAAPPSAQRLEWTEAPAAARAPDLVVFLIHGLRGDEATFGDLPVVLDEIYGDRVRIGALRYSTDSRTLRVADFVAEVQRQILGVYHDPRAPISTDTPFAFVMHSQGGIVGLRWVERCLFLRDSCPEVPGLAGLATPRDLRLFITFGTPFWGSPTATYLRRFPWLVKRLGGEQVRNLSFGGMSLASNRKAMLLPVRRAGTGRASIFPAATEVINVAGDVSAIERKPMRRLLKLLFSFSAKVENDFVVDDTAARLDFYYFLEPDPGRRELGGSTALSGRTREADAYFALPRPHVSLFRTNGLADIRRGEQETDLSFAILRRSLDRLLGLGATDPEVERLLAAPDGYVQSLQVFSAEVRVYGPRALQRPIGLEESSITLMNRSPDLITKVRRRNAPILNQFHGVNRDDAQRAQVRYETYFHQGAFREGLWSSVPGSETAAPEGTMGYRLEVEGFVPEELSLTVSPSFNSYAEVRLEPFLPIPPLGRLGGGSAAGEEAVDGRYLEGFQKAIVAVLPREGPAQETVRAAVADLGSREIETVVLEQEGWEKQVGSVSPASISELPAWCWEAKVGEHGGIHRGALYSRLGAPAEGEYGRLPAGRRVRVLGRFAADRIRGDPYYFGFDRYLVRAPGHRWRNPEPDVTPELSWMNAVDLDITGPCVGRPERVVSAGRSVPYRHRHAGLTR